MLFTVKGAVYEFNLGHFFFQKEIQLLTDTPKGAEVHGLLNGRKTVTAGERTASAALIVNDTVLKVCQLSARQIFLFRVAVFFHGV